MKDYIVSKLKPELNAKRLQVEQFNDHRVWFMLEKLKCKVCL